MFYNISLTTVCFWAVLLHTTGVILSATIVPDIIFTPPLEFPSNEQHVRIIQATAINLTKSHLYPENHYEITTNTPTNQLQEEIEKQLSNGVLKSSSQPINVIAKISGNYTENVIENKYYNNHIEEDCSSIVLTSIVLLIMAVIVLTSSAICFKKIQNLKVTQRELLIEDSDYSAMSDLIHVHHV